MLVLWWPFPFGALLGGDGPHWRVLHFLHLFAIFAFFVLYAMFVLIMSLIVLRVFSPALHSDPLGFSHFSIVFLLARVVASFERGGSC